MSKKTFILKGAAAGAFTEAQLGKKPKTAEGEYARVATFVHLNVQLGHMDVARLILETLEKEGLHAAVALLTATTARTKPSKGLSP